jgi:sialate O-acetylesterase
VKTAITLAALVWTASAAAAPTLGPAYGDHMVLQRDVDVVISGSAPGQKIVRGTLATVSVQSQVNSAGDSLLVFPAQSDSEEGFAVTVSDSSGTTTLSDIRIDDVYLCAGQSTVELTVNRPLDTYNQPWLAADDGMRLLKIPKDTAPAPRAEFAEPVA